MPAHLRSPSPDHPAIRNLGVKTTRPALATGLWLVIVGAAALLAAHAPRPVRAQQCEEPVCKLHGAVDRIFGEKPGTCQPGCGGLEPHPCYHSLNPVELSDRGVYLSPAGTTDPWILFRVSGAITGIDDAWLWAERVDGGTPASCGSSPHHAVTPGGGPFQSCNDCVWTTRAWDVAHARTSGELYIVHQTAATGDAQACPCEPAWQTLPPWTIFLRTLTDVIDTGGAGENGATLVIDATGPVVTDWIEDRTICGPEDECLILGFSGEGCTYHAYRADPGDPAPCRNTFAHGEALTVRVGANGAFTYGERLVSDSLELCGWDSTMFDQFAVVDMDRQAGRRVLFWSLNAFCIGGGGHYLRTFDPEPGLSGLEYLGAGWGSSGSGQILGLTLSADGEYVALAKGTPTYLKVYEVASPSSPGRMRQVRVLDAQGNPSYVHANSVAISGEDPSRPGVYYVAFGQKDGTAFPDACNPGLSVRTGVAVLKYDPLAPGVIVTPTFIDFPEDHFQFVSHTSPPGELKLSDDGRQVTTAFKADEITKTPFWGTSNPHPISGDGLKNPYLHHSQVFVFDNPHLVDPLTYCGGVGWPDCCY